MVIGVPSQKILQRHPTPLRANLRICRSSNDPKQRLCRRRLPMTSAEMPGRRQVPNPHMQQVLFVEVGTGCDQHGQNVTKAAARACRNAIEFNSIPSVSRLVPGGYENLLLHIKIGVPHPDKVDLAECHKVFPYGTATFEVVDGGLSCGSGIAIDELGDKTDEMVVAIAAVTVGFGKPSSASL